MSEYEELAKQLRSLVVMDEAGSNNPLGREAAATIEVLVKKLDKAKCQGDALAAALRRMTEQYSAMRKRAEKAEAEVERLKLALWDIATNADAASDLPLFRVQCRDFARSALEAKP